MIFGYRIGSLKKARLRSAMRGYRLLKQRGQLALILDLVQSLRDTHLHIPPEHCSQKIFGAAFSQAELVIRQTLSGREHAVIKAILVTLGGGADRVTLPLPERWLRKIEASGFKVNYLQSSISFFLNGWKQLLIGYLQVGVNLIKIFTHPLKEKSEVLPYVYFCDLVDTNLPQPPGNENSYCVINWYLQWMGRVRGVYKISHGVADYDCRPVRACSLHHQRTPIPLPRVIRDRLRYFTWAIYAISISTFDLLRGRWWHAHLLRETPLAAIARFTDRQLLARQYFFHNSRPYPPLWSYELPLRDSEAVFYWYSINSQPIKRRDGLTPLTTLYSLSNWPRYLVWDDEQSDFVKRFAGKEPKIEIVGPIWFQDSEEPLIKVKGLTIAVFGVEPFRASRYCLIARSIDYTVPEITNRFILDITDLALNFNAKIFWKRKRDIGRVIHPSFERCSETIRKRANVSILEPSISAFRVIHAVDIVVSMPFTSTALAARHLGKPSAYYDPSSLLVSNDPAAREIPMLQGRRALAEWLSLEVEKLGAQSSNA
jgi:polysaccharide biosynthesis PFTS motif protein